MPFDYSKIIQYRDQAYKKSQEIKTKIWNNESNKLTFLFLVAAILVALFTYYQFAHRHFVISATSQKNQNKELKNKLDTLTELNKKIQGLLLITNDFEINAYFSRKVKETGVEDINHEAELLLNCSQQFKMDEEYLINCNNAL